MSGFFGSLIRPISFTVACLLTLVLLTGCQQSVVEGRFVSEKGVSIEALLPGDLFVFAKFGSRDQEQLANLRLLNSHFPGNPLGVLVSEFNKVVNDEAGLEELGLDYQRDLLPLLKESSELYLALVPGLENSLESVRALLIVTIADVGAADRLLNDQLGRGNLYKRQHRGVDYFLTVEADSALSSANGQQEGGIDGAYLTRLEDVLLVASEENLLLRAIEAGVDKTPVGEAQLAANPVYRRALENYRPGLFLLYGDFQKLFEFLSTTEIEGQQLLADLELIASETLALRAEKEGLRMNIQIIAREGVDLSEQVGSIEKSYLYKQLPAGEPLFYSEGYNFGQTYEKFIELAGQDQELSQGLAEMERGLLSVGLDFKQDILTFLDRGYALVLEDNDSVFPALAFYLDVRGNVEGAEKTFARLHLAIDEMWREVKAESPEITMVLNNEEVEAGRLWRFKLNLDLLLAGQDPALIKKLSGQKVEFYYGILSDQIAVFALKPSLPELYGRAPRVGETEEFRRALKYLNGAVNGVTYLAPAQTFVYLDRLVELAKSDGFPSTQFAEYETVKSYLRPLKSLVVGAHDMEKDQAIVEVFLHISK